MNIVLIIYLSPIGHHDDVKIERARKTYSRKYDFCCPTILTKNVLNEYSFHYYLSETILKLKWISIPNIKR